MRRHILITSALLLGSPPFRRWPRPSRSRHSRPRRSSRDRAPSRSAPPSRRSGSNPPRRRFRWKLAGEAEIKVVHVPTIGGRMPEDIVGQTVKNSEGEDIGEVRDFVTQPDSPEIDSLVLSRSRLLGLGEKLVTIPWDKVRVEPQSHESGSHTDQGRTG